MPTVRSSRNSYGRNRHMNLKLEKEEKRTYRSYGQIPQRKPGRVCATLGCDTILNIYNLNDTCEICKYKARKIEFNFVNAQ